MPAEYILLLMACVPVALAFMDVWGDPGEDPRAALASQTPRINAPRPQADTRLDQQAAMARLLGAAGAKPVVLAKGPAFTQRALPVPRHLDHWDHDWRTRAQVTRDGSQNTTDVLMAITPLAARAQQPVAGLHVQLEGGAFRMTTLLGARLEL